MQSYRIYFTVAGRNMRPLFVGKIQHHSIMKKILHNLKFVSWLLIFLGIPLLTLLLATIGAYLLYICADPFIPIFDWYNIKKQLSDALPVSIILIILTIYLMYKEEENIKKYIEEEEKYKKSQDTSY